MADPPAVAREESTPRSSWPGAARPRITASSTPAAGPQHAAGPGPGDGDLFLTVAEVAALQRVSRQTVYRLVWCGDLPAQRTSPHTIRIRTSALAAYLAPRPRRRHTRRHPRRRRRRLLGRRQAR
jgi:excisionase family DNA binding protein